MAIGAFLQGWSGTLVCDGYAAYDTVFKLERRIEAGCLAHARRKFDELIKFRQALRQTEGLMASIFELLKVELKAPDHSTVSRRAMRLKSISKRCALPAGPAHILIDSTGLKVFGAGEWLQEKHGQKSRRSWGKLHLAVDGNTGLIVVSILTEQDVDDPSQVGPLLDQIEHKIGQVTADGAYDGEPTYETIAQHDPQIEVVIPPRAPAQPSPAQRTV